MNYELLQSEINLGIKGKIDKTSLATPAQFSDAILTPRSAKSFTATAISAIHSALIEYLVVFPFPQSETAYLIIGTRAAASFLRSIQCNPVMSFSILIT